MVSSGVLTTVMVGMECLNAGTSTLTKSAMNHGRFSNLVFLLYMNIVAALFLLLPSFFLFFREGFHPRLTFPVIYKIFVLGLVSFCLQICMIYGLRFTSPTQTSAMTDLAPAFTFLFAAAFGMEKLDLRIQSSRAKAIGTLILVVGGLTISLYKGPPIAFSPSPSSPKFLHQFFGSSHSNWLIGCLFLIAGCLFLSLMHIVQTWVIRAYPVELIVTFVSCIFVTIQCAIASLIIERNPSAWKLTSRAEIVSILISAILLTAVENVVHTWACREKGPVYTTVFKPLKMAFAIVMGIAFLGDALYLGSLIGGLVIVLGFYSFIWGQARQQELVQVCGGCSPESSSHKTPLLQREILKKGISVPEKCDNVFVDLQ